MTPSPPEISSGCDRRPTRRVLPTPSERNLQVYEAVGLRGQGQAAVARQFGLSQQRVSQICRPGRQPDQSDGRAEGCSSLACAG